MMDRVVDWDAGVIFCIVLCTLQQSRIAGAKTWPDLDLMDLDLNLGLEPGPLVS
ncbi:hypothetical protein QIS74_05688 [Colletotrichum tabaci]|uniref:Uncharacterized protein n=1 Tax=Colletotrichum tabaci TaxID=1209068 RepID=A0AAV9TI89_9PEZI